MEYSKLENTTYNKKYMSKDHVVTTNTCWDIFLLTGWWSCQDLPVSTEQLKVHADIRSAPPWPNHKVSEVLDVRRISRMYSWLLLLPALFSGTSHTRDTAE